MKTILQKMLLRVKMPTKCINFINDIYSIDYSEPLLIT